jgi:recombination protein RecT
MSPFELLIGGLKARRALFDAVLPKHMNVDRFMRSVLVAVTRQPKILDCSLESIYKCCHEAATLGLEVSGILGSAYLVPFKRECTLIPGYRGLIGLARQSGEVETIDAFAVYEQDECRVQLGTEPSIHHVPKLDGSDRGKLKAVYAVAKIFNGGRQFVYMPRVDVEKIRDSSNGYKASKQFKFPTPWDDHFEAMALKTAIRRLIKVLPISVEKLARAQELDDAHDEGKAPAPAVIDVEAFSKMVDDAQAAEKAAGAVGQVAAAVDGKPAGEAAQSS